MAKQSTTEAVAETAKPPKTRSPGYPAFDLATAIGKLPALYAAMKRHAVSVETATGAMGLSFKGSTGKLAIAALRAYGLIEGRGEVKLSRRGLDLGVDYKPTEAEWKAAAKEAALAPEMHRILWEKYGAELPVDDELRRFLVRDHGFNDNTVGQFVADYKKTIEFSGLANDGPPEKNEDDQPAVVKVGDFVQWTSQGAYQFEQPRKVVGIADGGEWAFVEDSDTGVAVSELTVVDPPTDAGNLKPPTGKGTPPANPFFKSPLTAGRPTGEVVKIPVTLPTLKVAWLEIPFPLTEAEYQFLTATLSAYKQAMTTTTTTTS